jgi:hypothetical protein
MYSSMNGHCSDTGGKAWDPLAAKVGLLARASPAATPGMCF